MELLWHGLVALQFTQGCTVVPSDPHIYRDVAAGRSGKGSVFVEEWLRRANPKPWPWVRSLVRSDISNRRIGIRGTGSSPESVLPHGPPRCLPTLWVWRAPWDRRLQRRNGARAVWGRAIASQVPWNNSFCWPLCATAPLFTGQEKLMCNNIFVFGSKLISRHCHSSSGNRPSSEK